MAETMRRRSTVGGVSKRVGAACWLLTAVYFAVQPVVAAAWDPAYSFTANTISDLGNARCEPTGEAWRAGDYLCSPRHALMNLTFVVVGVCTALGAVLLRGHWPPGRLARSGLAMVGISGVGAVLVGLAPGDVNMTLHLAGAGLQFPGAVGPLLLGLATPRARRWERGLSITAGVVGVVGCLLFASGLHLGLGVGGTERLGFDPLTVWTIALGAAILWRSRLGSRPPAAERADAAPPRRPADEATSPDH